MTNWAMFWIILLAATTLILAFAVYVVERERRREYAAKLEWKRDYYTLHSRPAPLIFGTRATWPRGSTVRKR